MIFTKHAGGWRDHGVQAIHRWDAEAGEAAQSVLNSCAESHCCGWHVIEDRVGTDASVWPIPLALHELHMPLVTALKYISWLVMIRPSQSVLNVKLLLYCIREGSTSITYGECHCLRMLLGNNWYLEATLVYFALAVWPVCGWLH